MNDIAQPLSNFDRVKEYMREHATAGLIPQGAVVDAFKDLPASVVRLTLQALRKEGVLGHHLEEGKVSYIWRGDAKPDGPPLRQETRKFATTEPEAIAFEKVAAAIARLKSGFKYEDLVEATRLPKDRIVKAITVLEEQGKVFRNGHGRSLHFTLTPSAPPTSDSSIGAWARAAVESTERFVESAASELSSLGVPPHLLDRGPSEPKFGYYNDGTLRVDCTDCRGVLKREDLDALRKFINGMSTAFGD
jgi:hypothetical protein